MPDARQGVHQLELLGFEVNWFELNEAGLDPSLLSPGMLKK